MAFTPIQSDSSVLTGGVAGAVLAGNCQIGSCVVLCFATRAGTINSIGTITSAMGTFTQVNSESASVADSEIWVCQKTTGAASTITTGGGGTPIRCFAIEYPPVLTVASVAPTSGGGSTASLTASGLTAGQAVVAMFTNGTDVATSGPSSPWTDVNSTNFGWANQCDAAYQTVTASSVTATWGLPSDNYQLQGVVLTPKPSSGNWFAFFARH